MKENQKRIFPLTMVLKIFIISFAIMAIPAAAENAVPELPLVLQGNVKLDGEFPSVGDVLSVELDGQSVGTIIVGNDGEYVNFPVTCSSEDYSSLEFFIKGIKAELVDATVFDNADSGVILKSVDFVATSPVSPVDNSDGGSSGGSGYSGTATTSDSSTNDESSSGSTASAGTAPLKSVAATESTDNSAEEVPAPETGSSMMAIVIGAIILLGIIVTVGYKLKEN